MLLARWEEKASVGRFGPQESEAGLRDTQVSAGWGLFPRRIRRSRDSSGPGALLVNSAANR